MIAHVLLLQHDAAGGRAGSHVSRKEATDHVWTTHRREHGPQGIVDGEDVSERAPDRDGEDHFPGQAGLRQDVEKCLQGAGVCGLVHRCDHDEPIGALEQIHGGANRGRIVAAPEEMAGGNPARPPIPR